MKTPLVEELDRHGFVLIRDVVSGETLMEVAQAVSALGADDARFHPARHLLARCSPAAKWFVV